MSNGCANHREQDFSLAIAKAPSRVIACTCAASGANVFALACTSRVISIMPLATSRFAAATSADNVSHRGGVMRPIRISN